MPSMSPAVSTAPGITVCIILTSATISSNFVGAIVRDVLRPGGAA